MSTPIKVSFAIYVNSLPWDEGKLARVAQAANETLRRCRIRMVTIKPGYLWAFSA